MSSQLFCNEAQPHKHLLGAPDRNGVDRVFSGHIPCLLFRGSNTIGWVDLFGLVGCRIISFVDRGEKCVQPCRSVIGAEPCRWLWVQPHPPENQKAMSLISHPCCWRLNFYLFCTPRPRAKSGTQFVTFVLQATRKTGKERLIHLPSLIRPSVRPLPRWTPDSLPPVFCASRVHSS
jgi:hypothetical protein